MVTKTEKSVIDITEIKNRQLTGSMATIISILLLAIVITVLSFVFKASTTFKFLACMSAITVLFIALILLLGDKYLKYTLVIPSAVVLFAVTIVPVAFLLIMSFTDVKLMNFKGKWKYVGFDNYVHFFTNDSLFLQAFIRTLEYTIVALIIQLIIGMLLALLLQKKFKGRNIVSSFLVIPVMTCPIVIAMLWKSMLNSDNGVINNILRLIGMNEVHWLTNEPLGIFRIIPFAGDYIIKFLNGNIGFLTILIVNTWQWTPFVFLMLMAGLSALSPEPYEAAIVDGANKWKIFRYVTLPLLKPVINVVIIMRLIDLMKVYDQIYALFGDNITMRTLNIHIFAIGLTNQDYGKGSALSVIVLVFIILLTKTLMTINENIGEKR